ncbi:putative Ubiquitin carboxyl-terminal hydrolase 4 [Monocercomonoides exilis]|uniref:putative Ubiquitin carboxyl-terminal hydrolase 4 n=1 Tax=Monocercomonoides exilis TaxID=2049356 RepID=UPI0035597FFD|nr:putative Ubiquitin carboxyl-terminal hydrolase 4 [Monocercomonoides exilis]|eukprot:MONOS_254.2-p1 / transcript=MONOS_254.2 / gene=MONOS_254 / organism=Monocercomonoides_exilis_PA203 / gene_product=Ubiquitin carboxyl-terminal hydrolase 4 , calcineurin regulatory subunit B / transcript_product=Ubiquitin carboxyl-terminal hydrolase 4 / location=Mono_scaffold00004:143462-146146(+) / protein_length=777 / sequence_SO=supercontig / SO=protein_coding / is_pseudo=false
MLKWLKATGKKASKELDVTQEEQMLAMSDSLGICYASSPLQVLYFCTAFRSNLIAFYQRNQTRDIVKDTPPYALGELFYEMTTIKKIDDNQMPYDFIEKLKTASKHFRTNDQLDACEFIQFMLKKTSTFLQKLDRPEYLFSSLVHSLPSATVSPKEIFNHGKFEKPEVLTIVDEAFRGEFYVITRCLSCERVTHTVEPFTYITINPKHNSSVNHLLGKKAEFVHLSVTDNHYCYHCHTFTEAEQIRRVGRAPKTLVIHIPRIVFDRNRRHLVKDTSFVSFPKTLRLGALAKVDDVIGDEDIGESWMDGMEEAMEEFGGSSLYEGSSLAFSEKSQSESGESKERKPSTDLSESGSLEERKIKKMQRAQKARKKAQRSSYMLEILRQRQKELEERRSTEQRIKEMGVSDAEGRFLKRVDEDRRRVERQAEADGRQMEDWWEEEEEEEGERREAMDLREKEESEKRRDEEEVITALNPMTDKKEKVAVQKAIELVEDANLSQKGISYTQAPVSASKKGGSQKSTASSTTSSIKTNISSLSSEHESDRDEDKSTDEEAPLLLSDDSKVHLLSGGKSKLSKKQLEHSASTQTFSTISSAQSSTHNTGLFHSSVSVLSSADTISGSPFSTFSATLSPSSSFLTGGSSLSEVGARPIEVTPSFLSPSGCYVHKRRRDPQYSLTSAMVAVGKEPTSIRHDTLFRAYSKWWIIHDQHIIPVPEDEVHLYYGSQSPIPQKFVVTPDRPDEGETLHTMGCIVPGRRVYPTGQAFYRGLATLLFYERMD